MLLSKQVMKIWVYAAVAAVVLTPGAVVAQTAVAAPVAAVQAAQASTGTRVHGTGGGPDGEVTPGAKVTLTPARGSAAKQVTSGSDGTYSVTVPPGSYTLVVSMPGFATYSALNV